MLSLSNLKNECCILTLTIHAANYVPAQITKNTTGVLERNREPKMKQSCTVNAANDANQTGIWHTVKQTSRAKLTVIRPTSFIFCFLLICLSILHLC